MSDFFWDAAESLYRDIKARLVPRHVVRVALDAVLDEIADDIEDASRKFIKAAETPPEEDEDDDSLIVWVASMESLVKMSNVIAGTLAIGGILQATDETRRSISDRVLTQYEYLRGFVDEIRDGLPLDEAFVARSRMYGLSGTGTFEEAARRGAKAVGYTEKRRYLASERPCGSCIAYAGQGWVPIGTLPGIGQDCECHSNCRCSFAYRIKR